MEGENLSKYDTILNKLYNIREEKIGRNINELKSKLNNVSQEQLQNLIEKSIENVDNRDKILKNLDLLLENYEMKMALYMEEGYKQGFKDAFELVMECNCSIMD